MGSPEAVTGLADRFRAARRDRRWAVLEGFHAVKHALRFGAEIAELVCLDPRRLERLARELAPDLTETLAARAATVAPELFAELVPEAPATGVVALARRPDFSLAALLADPRPAPVVLLEQPRHLGNLGAVVRVAAAAGAAGVLAAGVHDPWHPDALRGGAGLQFALPVGRIDGEEALSPAEQPGGEPLGGRPIVALHPEGEPLRPGVLPPRVLLTFGTERRGLSPELLARAHRTVAIPMQPGVSSLNLATAVAVALYGWRLGAHP